MRGLRARLLLLFTCVVVRGQAPSGTLAGVVTDITGSPAPGVSVRLTNHDRGFTRCQSTSQEVFYTVPRLPPGIYVLSVEGKGSRVIERTVLI